MLRTHRIPGIKNKSLTKIVQRYFKFLIIFAKKILRFYSFPILWDGSRNSCYICICIRPNTEKEKPLNIYIPRLFVKVRYSRYSGCAPMFRKCRLHSNGHSKSSYDVTNYWRGWSDNVVGERGREGFSPILQLTSGEVFFNLYIYKYTN